MYVVFCLSFFPCCCWDPRKNWTFIKIIYFFMNSTLKFDVGFIQAVSMQITIIFNMLVKSGIYNNCCFLLENCLLVVISRISIFWIDNTNIPLSNLLYVYFSDNLSLCSGRSNLFILSRECMLKTSGYF